MTTVPIPTRETRDQWKSISEVCTHYKVTREDWRKIANALGDPDFDDIGLLVGVSDEDFAEAREAAGFTPLKKGALNLVFGVCKLKFGVDTNIIKYMATELSTGESATTPSAAKETAEGSGPVAEPAPTLHAKVRIAQTLNQAIDQEVAMLPEAKLADLRKFFIEIIGDEPLQRVDATDAQLTALSFVVECGLAPYADFGVFGPHGTRQEKRMRFAQHFQDTTGKWRAVEQPGPPNIEAWRQCWETFTVAAVTLKVARPAVLARYAQKIEERCTRYSRAWHLCVRADDRCRAEFWAAERRRQQRFAEAHPDLAAVDATMPWNSVIKESADNVEFWLNELQEPALLYAQVREDPGPQGRDWARKGERSKGKGGHKGDTRGYRYSATESDLVICLNYNRKGCRYAECKRAHQCNICLGHHPAPECPRSKKASKKGKGAGGGKKGDSASSQ